jgi:murein DD-endopeptidase MepM/ murein hydrolase activator NlpD
VIVSVAASAVLSLLLLAGIAQVALEVRIVPPSPRQGALALILVAGAREARELTGTLGARPLAFFGLGNGHAALVGIDLETPPGKISWRVAVVAADGTARSAAGTVTVKARQFAVQRLTLPPNMVDLDPETERRAESETARLRAVYDTVTPMPLWRGRFVRPVAADGPGEGFGFRRIINGKPRMPHSGIDFAADRGEPVVAANRGRVALVGEFFFPGRLVVLDHGLGLHTLYFHLDRIDVAEGAVVERGEPIGAVGATGRATGPHLHFGAQLGRARVDPAALLALPLTD